MKRPRKTEKGFTLVEMAMVILITGVFLLSGIVLLHSYLRQSHIKTTQGRMQAIETAINSFYQANGRLPCVASLTDLETAGTFGKEIGYPPPADCRTAVAAGVSSGTGKSGVNKVQVGAVPVRTLNLPDQDMTDAWNDNFIYAVTAPMASATLASGAATGVFLPVTTGEITLLDSKGHSVTNPAGSAQYVLISNGADRVGAFSGGIQLGACTAGTTETPNCNVSPAPPSPVTFAKTLLNSDVVGAGQYDDYVEFNATLGKNGTIPKGMIMTFDGDTAPACPAIKVSSTNPALVWAPPNNVAIIAPFTTTVLGSLQILNGGSNNVVYCEKQ